MKKQKIKTEWNLKLLYKSHTDPQIEKDVKEVERLNEGFSKKYKNKGFTKPDNNLYKALKDYESLALKAHSLKALHYFELAQCLNSDDSFLTGTISKLNQRLSKSFNETIFFELELGKIPENHQKVILRSIKFKHFKYFLENIFKSAKHNLSEGEEKILSLKSLTSRSMWIQYSDKTLSKQTIEWKKQKLPINEALSLIQSLETKDRRQLGKLIYTKLKNISDFAEAEINAVYTDKKINDELRKFKNPYDASLLSHETDEKTVFALNKAVQENNKISHNFYKLKAKLLKLKVLEYVDRAAAIGKTNKQIPFQEAVEIVEDSFNSMDDNFKKILTNYVLKGQIDVFPKKGKTGGALCSGMLDTPTFILLNYTPSMSSVMTLAHEVGHGIHFEYIKKQPPLYVGVSTAVAEVASTFFEEVVFDNLLEKLNKKEKIIALHDRLNGDISTIFRQMAVFNFELELHKLIRQKGAIPKEEIAKIMNEHMKSYLGPIFDLDDLDGYFFVNWSHIRNFFYVYSYAYGQLISKALYRKYKQDKSYIEQIKQFLSAGSSKSPYQIFKDIGIDTSDPNFWKEGLKEIENDIKLLEKLAKEAKMIK